MNAKKRFLILLSIALVCLVVTFIFNWDALIVEFKIRRAFNRLGKNEQGYHEYEHQASGLVMVLLPKGEFQMGSPRNEIYRRGDEKLRAVGVNSFLISKYEVSQAVWEKYMGSNPSYYQGVELPVEKVSWDECFGQDDSFCKKLGLTLPTEAQWEYACRAGTTTPYSFGKKITTSEANFNDTGDPLYSPGDPPLTKPIGSYQPNPFGLHDMHGNVKEWCLDVHGEAGSQYRIVKGGGWHQNYDSIRSAARENYKREQKYDFLGFRPVYLLSK